ncbi:adenylate/guanylate cyclase domain-containing protein [Exiguobacterium sp. K1]|uniref:adenylate/guanylate cyclase domain-containing protein n=1 Tax=Exiguobacterium sp. K1 TaxID=2980105 RepID=UPI00299D8099|nr:adenylate/guanylate cyclase domain-containing protein [Exiguobacterium sp. K1]MDX1260838.1 adenylate/guanylate cyclase domain-containing protein [Exiguobacterium sp. K1]
MRGNNQAFDFERSLKRIKESLYDPANYEEADDIPKKESLTFTSGKYVQCASLFVDLRGSSDLIKTQKRHPKTLARLYRAYISEMVAIVNSFKTCKEVNIIGDCVSAMFAGDQGDEKPVIEALRAASMCNGMMEVLNVHFKKKWGAEFKPVKAGIGVALGRALVIKAGHSGTGINDLIYMGDVVNKASKMCGLAYKEYPLHPICVTESVYNSADKYIANYDTNSTFQDFLTLQNHSKHGALYVGNFHRIAFHDWAEENK